MSTETKEQRIERIVERFRADPELQALVRKDLTALCEEMEREKWLPISDAPKDGRSILLSSRGYVTKGYRGPDGEHYCQVIGKPSEPFTHWQPLPQPPAT